MGRSLFARRTLALCAALGCPAALGQVASGTFTGDGTSSRVFTGLGFAPAYVVVKVDSSLYDAQLRLRPMLGDATKSSVFYSSVASGRILSLDPDGFTLGSDVSVNNAGDSFSWVAFAAPSGDVASGSYAGNGLGPRSITAGFAPAYLVLLGEDLTLTTQCFAQMPSGDTGFFRAAADTDAGLVEALTATGFQVGSDPSVNAVGSTYDWVAWRASPGSMNTGSYLGDGTASHRITGAGFAPAEVIVHASGYDTVHRSAASDGGVYFDALPNTAGLVDSLDSDGFTVGSAPEVNAAGTTYYWAAFGAPDAGAADAGGTDAGVADAGTTDAGTTDAGTDAGITDAGIPDAGGGDGGPSSSGARDAGAAGSQFHVGCASAEGLAAFTVVLAILALAGMARARTRG